MNAATRVAYMTFMSVVSWNADGDGCGAIGAELHEYFLKKGRDRTTQSVT